MKRKTARSVTGAVAAAAMLAASSVVAVPGAASAAPSYYGHVELVGGKKWKRAAKHRNWKRGYHHRRSPNWVGPAIGLGAGVVIGSMLVPRAYPAPRYVAPAYPGYHGYPNRDAYCHAKYRSYNSFTGTYTGYDGRQHYCRIP